MSDVTANLMCANGHVWTLDPALYGNAGLYMEQERFNHCPDPKCGAAVVAVTTFIGGEVCQTVGHNVNAGAKVETDSDCTPMATTLRQP